MVENVTVIKTHIYDLKFKIYSRYGWMIYYKMKEHFLYL